MALFQITPEHVLHAVGSIENAGAQACGVFSSASKNMRSRPRDAVALREECIIVEHFFVECPGIFGEAEGRVGAEQLRQINGIGDGMGIGKVGRPINFTGSRRPLSGEDFFEIKRRCHAR